MNAGHCLSSEDAGLFVQIQSLKTLSAPQPACLSAVHLLLCILCNSLPGEAGNDLVGKCSNHAGVLGLVTGLLINSCKLANIIFQLCAHGLTIWYTRDPFQCSPKYPQDTGMDTCSMDIDSERDRHPHYFCSFEKFCLVEPE